MPDEKSLKNLRRSAMDLLARREHSAFELKQKLSKKEYALEDIELVLSDLQKESLQSDARFTEQFISYKRSKGFGPLRILAELRNRGLAEDLIEDALKITDNAWLDELKRVFKRRFRVTPTDFQTRAKQMRFLQYRGFTADQINHIYESDADYDE